MIGVMARKQGSHSQITGPKVLAVARRLIAQHGYAAVSMRQIAGEVGVQAGALYNYTRDKQSLLFALLTTHMDELLGHWEQVDVPLDPSDALRCFVEFHITHHFTRQDSMFIAYMELRNLSDENFKALEKQRRAYEQELEDILRRGVASGAFTVKDARIMTMAIIPMLNGISQWFREDGRLSLDAICDQYWAMIRGMVGLRI